jgi:AcrR family transcriptional regulator
VTPCPSAVSHPEPGQPYFAEFVEGRRGEILDAALAVFAEKGYEGGTMREIATRLGVTEPALYRHYAGKEALFADLVAEAGDRVAGQVRAMLEALPPEILHESLFALIDVRRRHLPRGDKVKPIMKTLFAAAPHNKAFQEVFRVHVARPVFAALEEFVPRVDAYYGVSGSAENTRSRVRAFVSLFVGYFTTGMMLDQPDDDAAIVDAMLAIMGWGELAG